MIRTLCFLRFNLILESIGNNQEIPICRIENTPETPLTGSTPYLPSENIVNTSENMENVRPLISRKFPYKTRKLY